MEKLYVASSRVLCMYVYGRAQRRVLVVDVECTIGGIRFFFNVVCAHHDSHLIPAKGSNWPKHLLHNNTMAVSVF